MTQSQTTREMKIVTLIGRYRVLGELGKGTFGIVYHCADDLLHREVAIKVMREDASAEPVAAMLHEAQGAARLRHPAIVRVLDTGQTEDGRAYIVFEYISGRTLRERLEDQTFDRAEAIRWLADVADALHYAHKNGIVHRDVKPANILIDDDACAHLADFGLAKIDDQFVSNDIGRPVGTYCYMSPEQARGQSALGVAAIGYLLGWGDPVRGADGTPPFCRRQHFLLAKPGRSPAADAAQNDRRQYS